MRRYLVEHLRKKKKKLKGTELVEIETQNRSFNNFLIMAEENNKKTKKKKSGLGLQAETKGRESSFQIGSILHKPKSP